MSKFGRGSLAGTVAVTGMGRALAFASLQFLGGYGLFKGLTSSTAAAMRFGAAMTQLQTQTGASAGEVRRMSDAVLKMAPAVGTGPEDLAKGLYHIESSGIRSTNALKLLKLAAEGAKVGHADLESVTNALVGAQKSGSKGAGDFAQTMGILNAAVGAGNMRMEDLAKAMSSGVLPAGRNFGVGIKDIMAAITVLTTASVPAQVAATRLRTTIGFIGGMSAPTTKALKTIGLSSLELARTLRSQGLVPALELLQSHLNTVGKTAQAAVITKAFGAARSSTTVSTLLQQLPELDKRLIAISAHAGDFGKDWQATLKTADMSMNRLHASVQATEILIGQALEPVVTKLADRLTVWLSKSGNQKKVQETVTSAVKGTVAIVEKFYHAIDNLSKVFGGFTRMIKIFLALKILWTFSKMTSAVLDSVKALRTLANAAEGTVGKWGEIMTAQEAETAATVKQGAAAATTAKQFEAMGLASQSAAAKMASSSVSAAVMPAAVAAKGAPAVVAAEEAAATYTPIAAYTGYKGVAAVQARSAAGRAAVEAVPGDAFAGYAGVAAGRQYAAGLKEANLAAAKLIPTTDMRAVEVATAKVGYMGAAAGMASKTLGNAGLAATAGVLTYTFMSMALHATGLDKQLFKLGSWLGGHEHIDPITPQSNASQAVAAAATSIQQTGLVDQLGNSVTPETTNGWNMNARQVQAWANRQKLVATIKAKFNLSEHDAEVFVQDAVRRVQALMNERAINDKLNPRLVYQATFEPPKPPKPQLDFLSKLEDRMAQAQLDLAKGDQSAQQRIVAILRQRIDYDEKYAKIQEGLIKTDVKQQKLHASIVAKLRNDEAQSYQQINDALKNSFALPQKLQIEQAQASATTSSADDIAVAKKVAASVMKAIRSGRLTGDALVSAWNEWAGAMQTINSQAKNVSIPMKLQIEQAEASITASTEDDMKVSRKIAVWARTQLKTAKGADKVTLLGILKNALDSMHKSFSVPLRLQVRAAEAALTSGTADDRKAAQAIYNYAKRQLARGKKLHDLQMQLDALAVMGQEKSVLDQGGGVATAYTMASTHNLTARFKGLSRSQRVAAEQQLAQVEAHHGRVPTAGFRGANGQVVNTGDTTININGGDLKEVERVVLKVLQKNDRHTSPQRRGRYSGTRPG